MDSVRTEALIMERLSASLRTTNIYGYCATSLIVESGEEITDEIVPWTAHQRERGRISQRKLNRLQDKQNVEVFPFNNFTIEEKLDLAIQMAEAVAEMHGFVGCVIVNDDIHPDQWLQVRTTTGRRLILNDMNNAVFLDWSPKDEEYCYYEQSYGGDFHGPEEFVGGDVDESTDIWSVGNMIFVLLTGLWPYYNIPHARQEELQKRAIAGELPYINPAFARQSLIEFRLVEVMKLCHKRDPKERISIFEVVKHLHQTKLLREQELQATKPAAGNLSS